MKYIVWIAFALMISFNLSAQNEKIPGDRPKLVIGIVVEQMRYDYLTRYWNDFGNSGFKKLAIYGAWCQNNHLNYSLTQTAPGYATIATGSEPTEHGIVSDYWYTPLSNKLNTCIGDKNQKCTGGKAKLGEFSPHHLFCTSFSDEIDLYNQGKSKIISLCMNPQGAIISGGFAADAAYWFEPNSGNWVSSSYYIDTLPTWVKDFNEKHYPDTYLEHQWTLSLPEKDYNESLTDDNVYEYGINGSFRVFPYNYIDIKNEVKNYELLNTCPEGNSLTTDFAVNCLFNESLGNDNVTDFLFVNYSVPEHIGKAFGPNAIETQDMYIKLDKDIAHLIEVLEDKFGKQDILIYLTSNCGTCTVPTYLKDNKLPAGNFKHHYIRALLESYLKAIYGEGDWIRDFSNHQVYLNRTLIEDSQLSIVEVRNSVASFIMNSKGVAYAITANNLENSAFLKGMKHLMQNSYHPKRSGDVMISLKPGWLDDISYSSDHNSGYNYDTHVPLLWYGWKIKKQIITRPILSTDIAASISSMLNYPMPASCTGTPIKELTNRK